MARYGNDSIGWKPGRPREERCLLTKALMRGWCLGR